MGTAMVVDDSEFMRKHISEVLVNLGFEIVAESADGLEALDHFQKYAPDIIFMDIAMPRMDGIKAVHKIREMNDSVPIIMVSSMLPTNYIKNELLNVANDYIMKPFMKEQIELIIDEIFV